MSWFGRLRLLVAALLGGWLQELPIHAFTRMSFPMQSGTTRAQFELEILGLVLASLKVPCTVRVQSLSVGVLQPIHSEVSLSFRGLGAGRRSQLRCNAHRSCSVTATSCCCRPSVLRSRCGGHGHTNHDRCGLTACP